MIKILQILVVNLPLVFDTSGVSLARPLMRIALNEQQEVRSIQPNLVIPQNVWYRVNANPTNRVLVETDPDFTNQKRWLSSDYMFNALRYEPNQTQKRLGDGFYEQRLVREQINRLTGRNFVGDYTDFDSQYRGLMDAGVTFAQKFNLRPGIALSPSQVAQLTTDIVWLESESVTLPNGKVENVLVPKVYALAKKGDITGNGTLLSGNKVIHKGGEFINSGTVAGREVVQFDSESIRNSGNISGGAIVGKVSGDMENLGGTLEADRAILLNVAGSFTVRATEGDNTLVGTKINAKEATIEGSNINLLGTTDTQTNRSDNKSSSWSVGVFVGKSGGSTGLGIEGAASVGKGHSNSDSQVQNHTEINADRLTIKAKETTTLKGATANINHLALDTKNLHIESVQDIEKYDSKQTQGGVKAAFAWGSGASGSVQFSRNKANVDYAQVNQQSGFNIKESSTINVEENTHLKGGVINAQGDKANHSLKTGTLTTESIENRSDIKVSSISAGVSSDMTQMATSAMGAALSALGNTNESERSQTQAAISSNINVQITDSEKQKSLTGKTAEETLQSLNRDVANANQKLEKQDLTKAQERQEMAQTIGQISEDWLQFAVGDKLEEADKKRHEADAIEKENPTKATALRAQAQAIEAEYGLGSNLQMGVRAATAALQGLATGNVNQAAVGAASPYLNKLIKEQTTNADGSINKEANLIAHAVLGAVEAHVTGNNAAAGALGALTAEAAAPLIMQTLYGTEKPENLTDSQKQNVANLSQIAAGLSGGLVGDSTGSFVAGAEIGKRAVENNSLLVDAFRANKKANAEQWKQNVREKLGDNTASQVINGLISVIEEGADSALFVYDSAFDAFAVLTTCAIGDSYCSQAKIDLASKNEAVSKALGSLMNGEYWSNVKVTAQKAYSGDQQALETFSGMISGLLLPTKVLPNNPKLNDFSKSVPKEINSGSRLPIFDEAVNYPENIHFNINLKTHLIEGEGISQRRGVIGAHNKENFINTLTQGGGRIVKEESSGVDGISRIHYEIPRLGRDGTPDGTYKAISSPKTVYDPKKYSDEEMLKMGQEAAAKGYSLLIDRNRKNPKEYQDTQRINGIDFHYYIDSENKGVTNVHPK